MLYSQETKETRNSTQERIYRYLGLVALAQEKDTSPEYLEQQVITELAESLDTEMGTHNNAIHLNVDFGGKVYTQNGDDLQKSLDAWKEQWLQTSAQDDRYTWFSGITMAEANELHDVATFAKSAENGDILMVVSPFPEEAYENSYTRKTVAERGFRPDIRRSFIRMYEKTAVGVDEHIQSFDSSSVSLWNSVLATFNVSPAINSHALLERRSVFRGTPANTLIAAIKHQYDAELEQKTGKEHRYGRTDNHTIEANKFITQNPAIIYDTIEDLRSINTATFAEMDVRANAVLYKSKALLAELFADYLESGTIHQVSYDTVSGARTGAGLIAEAENKSFFGCSGESSVISTLSAEGAANSSLSSFSIHVMSRRKIDNGLEVHACVTCPLCGSTVDALYDPKAKSYSCVKKSCKGYNEHMIMRSKNQKNKHRKPEKDFGDMLVEFVFGNEEQRAKQQLKKK